MAVLGLASTGAFAAPANSQAGMSLQNDTFWQSIIHHNQDNASGVQMLQTGKNAISGMVSTQLANRSKRSGYAKNTATSKNANGNTSFSLHTAELYFDARPVQNVDVHVAMDYDNNFLDPSNTSTTNMFFPEANVTLTHGNMWATAGRQYGNFGSTQHHSITTPVTEDFSNMNQTGVTLGYAMRNTGLYGDVFIYNGVAVGVLSDTTPTVGGNTTQRDINNYNNSKNSVHGYSAEVGFAQKQGSNALFGNNGMNAALSFISNIQDTITFGTSLNKSASNAGGPASFKKAVPAFALHGDYTQGAFSVDADYVIVNKMKDTGMYFGKANSASLRAAMPAAYTLQAVYGFTTSGQHNNYVTLGFGGTQDAAGLTPFGSNFTMPKNRILVNYKYDMMKNVSVAVEYDMDTDYNKKESSKYTTDVAPIVGGTTSTGQTNSTVTARLNVAF